MGEENKKSYPKNIERTGRNVKWNLRQEDRDGVEKGGRGKVLRIGTRDALRDIRPKTGEEIHPILRVFAVLILEIHWAAVEEAVPVLVQEALLNEFGAIHGSVVRKKIPS